MTSLDLSTNTALTSIYCQSNQLTSLDVSNNRALTYLQVSNNKLTSLNIKNGVSAGELYAQGNSDLPVSKLQTQPITLLTGLMQMGISMRA